MTRSTALIALIALALLTACEGSSLTEDDRQYAEPGEVVAGEFIIGADLDDGIVADLNMEKLDFDDVLGAGLYRTHNEGITKTAMEVLLKDRVRLEVTVEANRSISALSTDDPYRYIQWNLDMLEIETVWKKSTGAGTTVAVIDTGVSWAGEDTPVNLVAGWDYVDNDSDPTDENGHGTHVAGTIAQATHNGLGVAGVAPDTTILAYRVLDRNGSGSVYWSAKAIRAAADAGADVINLSLGSPYSSNTESSAVAYAVSQGVVVVAASGNEGAGRLNYPAAYDNTIAVGAVRADGKVTSYSNGGAGLDLVAPGGDTGRDQNGDGYGDGILQETTDYRGTSYQFFEGTSMATPHVAAGAAILISAGVASENVRDVLNNTADGNGWDKWNGNGRMNLVAALANVDAAPPATGGGDTGGNTPPTETTDTTAPSVSNVSENRNGTSLTLYWTTDEPTSTGVEFQDYGVFTGATGLRTNHEMAFTIDTSLVYTFRLLATDDAGNATEDGWWVSNP